MEYRKVVLAPKPDIEWEYWVLSDCGEQIGEVDAHAEWYTEPTDTDRMLVLEHRVARMLGIHSVDIWIAV